jgi:glycosyltransferase involved in cell wall biosynthesis
MMVFISIIVTTYNWPSALEKVLQALASQTNQNFEILLADDGSGLETKALFEKYRLLLPVECKHIWQEDKGFRASAIRNQAVLQAQGQYLVFLDGDCIPRQDFVEKHITLAEQGYFVVGNRVLLTRSFTERVLNEGIPVYRWSFLDWCLARLKRHCNRCLSFISFPLNSRLRKCRMNEWRGAKGCNLGIFKSDLLQINGWEERFMGWGYEDSDLVIRLLNVGIKRKEGHFAVTVAHLWHPENDRSREKENWTLLAEVRNNKAISSEKGLNQYQ